MLVHLLPCAYQIQLCYWGNLIFGSIEMRQNLIRLFDMTVLPVLSDSLSIHVVAVLGTHALKIFLMLTA